MIQESETYRYLCRVQRAFRFEIHITLVMWKGLHAPQNLRRTEQNHCMKYASICLIAGKSDGGLSVIIRYFEITKSVTFDSSSVIVWNLLRGCSLQIKHRVGPGTKPFALKTKMLQILHHGKSYNFLSDDLFTHRSETKSLAYAA